MLKNFRPHYFAYWGSLDWPGKADIAFRDKYQYYLGTSSGLYGPILDFGWPEKAKRFGTI